MTGEDASTMEDPMGEPERLDDPAPGTPAPGLPAPEAAAGTGGAAAGDGPGAAAGTPRDGDDSLLALVDLLAALLEKSDLGELEVTAGGTTVVLRSPAAIERPAGPGAAGAADGGAPPAADQGGAGAAPATHATDAAPPSRPSVKAPLTGIYYGAPSPGATPYIAVGDHVSVGQIIGLIEAMKLFNEIKSDLAGRVVRICSESGALIKARQPLVEVEPA